MATKLFLLFFIALEVVLSQEEDTFGEGENASKEEDLQCDVEMVLKCPDNQFLPKRMASRSPFFKDSVGLSCTDMGKRIYEDEDVLPVTFVSSDGGLTLNADCPDTHPIISEFSFCLEESRVRAASLNCVSLIDACIIGETFNKTSDDETGYHQMVNCGDAGAIQGMHLMEADRGVTKVVFDCAKISCGGEESI